VALQAVIEQAVQACAPLAESAGHKVHVSLPYDPVYLHADSARLIQVFANLLNNSCKYTGPGGVINVTMEQRGNYAEVSVEDNGIGIAHDKLQAIFEPFTQVEEARGRSRGGLGIGLTLVDRLVQMHGGSVEATSAGIDRGSRFTVRLPITPSGSDPDEATDDSLAKRVPGRRILGDDDQDSASALLALLAHDGGPASADGAPALKAAETFTPDVAQPA
jgi:signal transduction histidine kinase